MTTNHIQASTPKSVESSIYNSKGKKDKKGNNLDLFTAAYFGDVAKVKELLEPDVKVNIEVAISKRNTPLMIACKKNNNVDSSHPEVVRLLLEKGAKVDAQDDHGDTPLMIALYRNEDGDNRYASIIKLLIEYGADTSMLCDKCTAKY